MNGESDCKSNEVETAPPFCHLLKSLEKVLLSLHSKTRVFHSPTLEREREESDGLCDFGKELKRLVDLAEDLNNKLQF